MTVAIFVEGLTDKQSIGILIRRLRGAGRFTAEVEFRTLRGRSSVLDVRSVCAFIRFNLIPRYSDLTGVVACVDMNCHTAAEIASERADIESQVRVLAPPVPLRYHFVRFALESWLAADEAPWRVLFPRAGPHFLPPGILENCKPKQTLREHLLGRSQNYVYPQHNPRVAELMDLDAALTQCPNLAEFIRLVVGMA